MKIFGWEIESSREREYKKWKRGMKNADETLTPEDAQRRLDVAASERRRLLELLGEDMIERENRQ